MTDWPRGGYPAGDTPASELRPPPASMISPQSHETRRERAIRREVANEIYEAIKKRRDEARDEYHRGWPLLTEAMVIAHEIGSKGSEQ